MPRNPPPPPSPAGSGADSRETLFRETVRATAIAGLAEVEETARIFSGSRRDLLVHVTTRIYEFRPDGRGFAARGLMSLLVHTAQSRCFYPRYDPELLPDEAALEGLIDLYLHGVLARPGDTA